MLKYTGHPLIDVGMATVAAFAGKEDPGTLTEADLDKFADLIERQYVVEPLKSYLNVAFPNSGYVQPAYTNQPEKRKKYARVMARAHKSCAPRPEMKCAFTGEPAAGIGFDLANELPPGRAFRQHVPLLTSEGIINFHAGGEAGLPMSGEALLFVQALPMGCAKCGGRLLAVHSDNPELTHTFAKAFLERNRQTLLAAQAASSNKMAEAGASPHTLLIETLLEAERLRLDAREERLPYSVTAYHLSNSGQSKPLDPRSPPLQLYHLPLQLTSFLARVASPDYRREWSAIEGRAWQLPGKKKGKQASSEDEGHEGGFRRNLLHEDLFTLPGSVRFFVRRYFLRIPIRNRPETDPRRGYSLKSETDLVSWKLTQLFLREVMLMDQERVSEIRDLGDRLADYISRENDRRFFTAFFAEPKYDYFRVALIKANMSAVKRGFGPLITLDPYLKVFEEGDELAWHDWRLARDLVLIRMIERLHSSGWLSSNRDALPEQTEASEPAS